VVSSFINVIAQHTDQVPVELLDDGDVPELERGNNFAKLGDWSNALQQYQSAAANNLVKPKVHAKALYDLGMGLGLSGKYDEAIAQLEQAFSLDPKDLYSGQIERFHQFARDDEKLAQQRAAARERK